MRSDRNWRDDEALEATSAIRMGGRAGPGDEETRWSFALGLFVRVMSILWIAQGLSQWRRVIDPAAGSFLDRSGADIAATVFFAVLDPIAAIGLWLIAPWGGVVWLLTLVAQVFVVSVKPAFFYGGGWLKLFDGVLFVIYAMLSWRANVAAGIVGPLEKLIDSGLDLLRARGRKE